VKRTFLWTVPWLLTICSADSPAQEAAVEDLCIVWYNTENLFYPADDSLTQDDEFTPEGTYHWTWSRYRDKLTSVAKVIIASGGWDPPGLVALCEIENANVLEELAIHPILAPYHYLCIHKEGPDHRGLEVACLIRKETFSGVDWEYIPWMHPITATRELMHLALCYGADTLDLFLVHLISKYGGSGATAQLRRIQAGQLMNYMDSVNAVRENGMIMAMGDFNDQVSGFSLEPLRINRIGGDTLISIDPAGGEGSYKYRGLWSNIDHVLVSRSLQRCLVRVSILRLPQLVTEDRQYGGIKPYRTYEGYQYRGGVSDHMPLVVELTLHEQ